MIEHDTVRLLRECDAGVKMGISSLEDVIPYVKSSKLKDYLTKCKREHEGLEDEIKEALHRFHDEGKDPNPIAKGMSEIKTNFKLGINESDETIAGLMTDGCHMGVKSLNKYLNEYKAADEFSKDITKRLIKLEDELAREIRGYL